MRTASLGARRRVGSGGLVGAALGLLLLTPMATAWSATVSAGDAQFSANTSGGASLFDIGAAGDQLSALTQWVSVNGGAPARTTSGTAFNTVNLVSVTGNTWTSAIRQPGVVRIDIEGVLTDDGPNAATAEQTLTFTNLTDNWKCALKIRPGAGAGAH